MKKNILICLFACLLLNTCLNGCSWEDSKEEVIVSGLEASTTTLAYQPAIKRMADKYPNFKFTEWTQRYSSSGFLPMAVSGQLPTVYYCAFTDPEMIISSGYAGDITDMMKKYKYDEMIKEEYLQLVERDGRYYGVPRYVYHMGLLCNHDLFKQAGLVDEEGYPLYPNNYEELAQTASIIKQRTGKAGLFLPTIQNNGGWIFMNIAWSYGVDFVKEINGKWQAAFNTPECVQALQYIKDLRWKYDALQDEVLGDDTDFAQKYLRNEVGMKFIASSELNRYIKIGSDINSLSVCKMPEGPKGRFSLVGGSIAMFNRDITPEQAEACFIWYDEFGYNDHTDEPARKKYEERVKINLSVGDVVGYINNSIWKNPQRKAMEEEVEKRYSNVDLNKYKEFNDKGVTYRMEEKIFCQELYHILDGAIQDVLMNEDSDPTELIREAAEKYQTKYLDPYNS